jgi:hypothetical protein
MGAPLPTMPRKPKVSKPIRNAKAAVKQTAKQARQIGKTSKAVKTAFKKITKALSKKAPKKATKKSVPKKPSPVKRSKRPSVGQVIKLKNIKQLQGKTWAQIVSDPNVGATLDKIKKPGEFFIGSLYGNQTHTVFTSGEKFVQYMDRYVETAKSGEENMVDTFTIARYDGTPYEQAVEADERIKALKQAAIDERRRLGEKYGKTTAQGKTKTFRNFAEDAERAADEAKQAEARKQSVIDSLLERVANLERTLGGTKKKSTKGKGNKSKKSSKKTSGVSSKARGGSKNTRKQAATSGGRGVKKNASNRVTKRASGSGASRAKGKATKPVSAKRSAKPKAGGKTAKRDSKRNTKAKPKATARKQPVKKTAKKPNNRRK